MKIFILFTTLLLAGVTGYTQQLHFAFLQTDTHKPFYVTLNKKNYSSTVSGYIILSKLQNGEYPIRIGFAKAEEAEQEYLLQVTDNDQGFLIKDFGDKGWGLFNLQTMAVQYAGTAAQEKAKLAAAEKAEAEQRQRKLEEESQAAETQRRNDSIKTAAIAQQTYADSIAAVATSDRQRMYEDSIAKMSSALQQNKYNDSVAQASAVADEAERLRKIADSAANAQAAAAIEKQKVEAETTNEQAKAVAKEAERLQKLADSTARAQAAAIEKQKEMAEAAAKNEKVNVTTVPPDNVPLKKNDTVKNIQLPVLIQQSFTDSGWHYAYNITNNNHRETVNVFIPAAQPKLPVKTAIEEKEVIPANAVKPDSTKFLNISISQDTASISVNGTTGVSTVSSNNPVIAGNVNQAAQPMVAKDSIPIATEKPILNSNCRALANEKDFLTARKKMAAVEGTDAMLMAFRKLLKEKCYTTDQLRNLSVLFLSDTDRYQFLVVAYPFAFDAYRYATLQDLLKEEYYVQRFKTMLR